MRVESNTPGHRRAAMVAALGVLGLLALGALAPSEARAGDEPRGLGKIFRFGKGREAEPAKPTADAAKAPAPAPAHNHAPVATPNGRVGSGSPYGSLPAGGSSYGVGSNPYGSGNPYGSSADGYNPLHTTAPAALADTGAPGPRLVPQPRVSRAVTEAPPLLTRISIGRSDNGQRFGMFLQVHADGTVLSTEGISRVGPETLRPLIDALRAADLGREREHCGGPPTDFIEQVHLTVYDQSRGRTVANQLTYSGNVQGCDPGLAALQAAIDAVQAKIASPAIGGTAEPTAGVGLPALGSDAAPLPPVAGPTVPLTPLGE